MEIEEWKMENGKWNRCANSIYQWVCSGRPLYLIIDESKKKTY